MEKLVYVLWKPPEFPPDAFRRTMLEGVAPRLLELGARGLSLDLVDEFVGEAERRRIRRLDPPVSGTVSLWLDSTGERKPFESALSRATLRCAGYRVTESVPLRNTTHLARPGERTPGIQMVALIERPAWIEREPWIAHWQGPHCQVALETQCTYAYVRNLVEERLTPDAPAWAGIVEEGFPAEAVTDPMLWFRAGGSPETLQRNLDRMLASCRAFLDLDRVESYPMSEYRIREPAPG